jgi:hypothetical protein
LYVGLTVNVYVTEQRQQCQGRLSSNLYCCHVIRSLARCSVSLCVCVSVFRYLTVRHQHNH